MEQNDPTTRRRFMKRAGVFLALAVGAGALVENAFAGTLCCADTTCSDINCPPFQYPCSCDCASCVGTGFQCLDPGHCIPCPC